MGTFRLHKDRLSLDTGRRWQYGDTARVRGLEYDYKRRTSDWL